MLKSFKSQLFRSAALKATTVTGLAVVVLATGAPFGAAPTYAEAVKIQAPTVPGFADVVSSVSPAVVSVRVESRAKPVADTGGRFGFDSRGLEGLPDDHPLKRFFQEYGDKQNPGSKRFSTPGGSNRLRPTAQGSGFFISEDGYIVTNNHVVSAGTSFIVVTNDGTELNATLVGKDSRTDLAVLKIDNPKTKFTYVQWADDSKARVGDWVVAVGNPFGLGGTVTAGIISARGRDIGSGPYDDYIQIDAAVNHGNSGGPTFNLEGQVIGINTAIFSPSGGNVGIAFDIPASVAKNVVADLMKDGKVSRGWLGVQIQPVTQDIADSLGLANTKGALVSSPQEDSPGQKAGIKNGDVITALNGEPVENPRDLSRRIAAMQPGVKVEIALWRNGNAQSVSVTLGSLPSEQKDALATGDQPDTEMPAAEKELADLGLVVEPAEDGKGLMIAQIDPDSDAADKGIKEGEKIVSVNNRDVASAGDVVKILNQVRKDGRTKALFQIESDNGSRFVALPLNQG